MTTPAELEFDPNTLSESAWRLQRPSDLEIDARFLIGQNQGEPCLLRGMGVLAAARRGAARSAATADAPLAATPSRTADAQDEPATDLMAADDALCIAERKLVRHLQRNRLSMSAALALGAAALTTGFLASQSFYRWAFPFAATWELGLLPLLFVAANRRLRRVLSLVRQELREGAAAAARRDAQLVSQ
jgi:hypothetical protein